MLFTIERRSNIAIAVYTLAAHCALTRKRYCGDLTRAGTARQCPFLTLDGLVCRLDVQRHSRSMCACTLSGSVGLGSTASTRLLLCQVRRERAARRRSAHKPACIAAAGCAQAEQQ